LVEAKVCVVIPAKNSARYLAATLSSLKDQSLKPCLIVVVDDGSSDNTAEVAERCGAKVIRLPDVGYYATGTPHIAKVINTGLRECLKFNPDFVMIAGSDDVFPRSYVEVMVREFIRDDKLVMVSGYVAGEAWKAKVPRGGGRVIRTSYIKKAGLYPLNYGWESYLVFKAWSLGFKTKVVPVPFISQRPASRNPIKFYFLGKGMRALGYTLPYALSRFMLTLISSGRANAVQIIRGYFTETPRFDIASYVKALQAATLAVYLLKPTFLIKTLCRRLMLHL